MRLISFSGAQSTGKTTLLNKLRDANYDNSSVTFVPEVTRVIHRDYDLPINEGAGSLTQLLVNAHHVENIYKKEPNHIEVKILDRCILDGFIYTRFLQNKDQNDLLLNYVDGVSRELCGDLIHKYDIIFHTSHRDVELIDDGQRSVNVEFRDTIINMFDIYVDFCRDKYKANIITLSGTVEERLQQIDAALKARGITNIKI
jgi:nicotinamide riboside kinase